MSRGDYETLREMHSHWYEQDAMTEMCTCQKRWPCDLQSAFDEIDRLRAALSYAADCSDCSACAARSEAAL